MEEKDDRKVNDKEKYKGNKEMYMKKKKLKEMTKNEEKNDIS